MGKIIILLLTMLPLLAAPSPYEQGKRLYFSKGCNGCHGISATGTSQYPSLAYRRKALLTYKLNEFRAKKGSSQLSEMMIPFAEGLSDAQIDALTTFLSDYHENKSTYRSDYTTRGDGGS